MNSELEAFLDRSVRPLIRADGGELTVVSVSDAQLELCLSGACSGCPGVEFTRIGVIEPALRRHLGDAVEIIVSNIPSKLTTVAVDP